MKVNQRAAVKRGYAISGVVLVGLVRTAQDAPHHKKKKDPISFQLRNPLSLLPVPVPSQTQQLTREYENRPAEKEGPRGAKY